MKLRLSRTAYLSQTPKSGSSDKLTLATHSQNQHGFDLGKKAVQRNITLNARTYHQLPLVVG